jgi:succinate dehydrogenase/fumarate reductase flavoprotein subunit
VGAFWAIPLYPALLNTQGGPKRNEKAQVIGVDNEPILGLYSAGELGSIWGTIYQGSSNIAECLVFGRIAARQTLKNH